MTTSICQNKQPNPCKKHGLVKRHKDGKCSICSREKCKKYLIDNQQKIQEYRRKYRKDNLDKLIKKSAEYTKNNKDKLSLARKEWYKKNADRLREESRLRRDKNIEKSRYSAKKWAIDNPEKRKKSQKEWVKNNRYADCLILRKLAAMKTYISCDLKTKDIPFELVELKRVQMKLLHAIKQREQQLKKVL